MDHEELPKPVPKPRVALSLPEATLILQKHRLGLSCSNVQYLDKVFNWRNSSYIITTSEGKEYFLRFSENWGGKCENERAAISLLRTHCPSLPVPEVLGFQNNFEVQGDKEKFDYIIFQKLPGVPLGDVFKSFNFSDKKKIVTNIVNILFQLQHVKFDKIGSFKFTSGGEVEVEEDFMIEDGPFDTYQDYIKALVKNEVKILSNCPYLLEGIGFEGLRKRIDCLIQKVCQQEEEKVPFVFTHVDFHCYNLLVDTDKIEISGLIDFEFSGSYPIDKEWYKCCSFIGVRNYCSGTFQDGLRTMSDSCTDLECVSEEELRVMRAFFFEECQRNGVRTPETIPGFEGRTLLHYFAKNICPWWIREDRGEPPEKRERDRETTRKRVLKTLEMFNC